MDINKLLQERQLPDILSREEMVTQLLDNEYGYVPNLPYQINISEPEKVEARYCCGTVCHSRVQMTVTTVHGSHTFPIQCILHTDGTPRPFFLFLSFRHDIPGKTYPTEEIADNGFDVLSVCYTDITSDNDDFSNGIAGLFLPNGQEHNSDCGKIALWAWAVARIMDYAQTLPQLDMTQAAIVGASRLGKTAFVSAMLDTRFRYAFSVVSGCCGAALARGNSGLPGQIQYNPDDLFNFEQDFTTGETVRDLLKNFPFWMCKNFQKYAISNIPDTFDQHFLTASIAPRFSYISSASWDAWADPVSEFLGGAAASAAYEKLGLPGLKHSGTLPQPGDTFHEGRIGYHLRPGPHFLCRYDWLKYMAYIKKHQFD